MSIRRYLVLILLSIITLVTFFAAIQGYKVSMSKTSDLFDAQLKSIAATLLLITEKEHGGQIDQDADIAFQVWQGDRLLLSTSNAPKTPIVNMNDLTESINKNKQVGFDQNSIEHHFGEANFLGQRWRTFVKTALNNKFVIVAQPIKRRFELAEDVTLSAVTPTVLIIPLLTLIISLAISRGLKPLSHLTKALKNKKLNDLTQLDIISDTKELEPVITTLNKLFERLSLAFERERHFASDAAHELRTPLSVLKINVHNLKASIKEGTSFKEKYTAKNSEEEAGIQQQLAHLVQSVDRMAHVVDQILTLNRTNPEQIDFCGESVDFIGLIQQSISELYVGISQRNQEISLENDVGRLTGNAFALGILVQNLIGNASKYTPENGIILVKVQTNKTNVTFSVEDSGPGIAPSEYARVFDRFYRVGGDQHTSKIIGCGLGLAIVSHIIDLHGAKISLSKSEQLKGLKVTVSFPLIDNIDVTPKGIQQVSKGANR